MTLILKAKNSMPKREEIVKNRVSRSKYYEIDKVVEVIASRSIRKFSHDLPSFKILNNLKVLNAYRIDVDLEELSKPIMKSKSDAITIKASK